MAWEERNWNTIIVTAGLIEGKHSRVKKSETMLDALTKWQGLGVERVRDALKDTENRGTCKVQVYDRLRQKAVLLIG